MSRHLARLLPDGVRLATPEFVRGDVARYSEEECAALVEPLERVVLLDDLDAIVDGAIARYSVADPRLDAHLAEHVHRALPITRREAADVGLFRFLSVIRYPELVRHRWPHRSIATSRSRFLRAGVRHDANAFSRWWWGAELTREGEDYALTRAIFARSSLATHLFSRDLARCRPWLEAAATVLSDETGPEVERRLGAIGKMLSVRVVEAMDRETLVAMMRRTA